MVDQITTLLDPLRVDSGFGSQESSPMPNFRESRSSFSCFLVAIFPLVRNPG
jgi:hypothetical protein